jgi:hypothetical protein
MDLVSYFSIVADTVASFTAGTMNNSSGKIKLEINAMKKKFCNK